MQMKKYSQIINIRTFQVLLICLLTSFFMLRYDIRYDFDLSIIGIAIVFPLVFSIRAAFRRREKAMEYLSRFKASLLIVLYCFLRAKKLDQAKKEMMRNEILRVSDDLIKHLTSQGTTAAELREKLQRIFQFVQDNNEEISSSEAFKIFRFLKDVHTSLENVVAVKGHRTPISLRAYCQIFIYAFPVIYTPSLLDRLDGHAPMWVVYTVSAVLGFILISLFNVQDQIEHPFDQHGLDDIRVDEFRLDFPTLAISVNSEKTPDSVQEGIGH